MKHAYPEFYRDALPSEKGHLYEMGYLGLIPGEDRAGHRLAVCIPGTLSISKLYHRTMKHIVLTIYIYICT